MEDRIDDDLLRFAPEENCVGEMVYQRATIIAANALKSPWHLNNPIRAVQEMVEKSLTETRSAGLIPVHCIGEVAFGKGE